MTNGRRRTAALFALLVFASGCGEDAEGDPGTHARGAIEAFGRPGERSLIARYVATLDDESCEAVDSVSECVLLRCLGEPEALEDAGEVTVGDDALDIAEDSSYSLVVPEEIVPGESLEMSASGSSAVPKHGGSVVVPELAELTSELASITSIDKSQDLVVTWTPVESDRVIFQTTFNAIEIECATTGSAGQITVGARLLNALPEVPGVFSLTNENLVEKTVSGWRIWFRAHQVIADGATEIAPAP